MDPGTLWSIWKFSTTDLDINPKNTGLSLMLFDPYKLWHLKLDGQDWITQEWTYLNANYTFKYRHKNASGTHTALQMRLTTCQPKASIDLLVLEEAMKSNLFKIFRLSLILQYLVWIYLALTSYRNIMSIYCFICFI